MGKGGVSSLAYWCRRQKGFEDGNVEIGSSPRDEPLEIGLADSTNGIDIGRRTGIVSASWVKLWFSTRQYQS